MHIKKFLIALVVAHTFLLSVQNAFATDIGFTPRASTMTSDSVSIDIVITNNTQSINAVSGSISFPAHLLGVASVSKAGSIISMWAEEPSYSNTTGTVRFEGVVLNPGFSGNSGKILTIRFVKKAQAQGVAQISLNEGAVLANDGQATNVLDNLGIASVTIAQQESVAAPTPAQTQTPVRTTPVGSTPALVSSSHPVSEKWYALSTAVFSWELPKEVTAVKLGYGKSASITPIKLYAPAIKEKTLTDLSEGTYYFAAQFRTAQGFNEVAVYPFNIDLTAPEAFEPLFDSATDTLSFQATDILSGVDRYDIIIDNEAPISVPGSITSYTLSSELSAGEHQIIVRAVDAAGNTTEALMPVTLTRPAVIEVAQQPTVRLFESLGAVFSKAYFLPLVIAILWIALLWYSIVRFRVLRKKIRRDLASIEETLKDDMVILREHLELSEGHISNRSKVKEKTEKMFKNSRDTIDIVERDIAHKIERLRKKI